MTLFGTQLWKSCEFERLEQALFRVRHGYQLGDNMADILVKGVNVNTTSFLAMR